MDEYNINERINKLELKIKQLESSIDKDEKISALELMKVKDELNNLKLLYSRQYSNCRQFNSTRQKQTRKDSIIDKPIKHINNEFRTKAKSIDNMSDIKFGKVILPLIAAVLIILAAATFVGTFWNLVPNIVKALMLIGTGTIMQYVGIRLYESKHMYPFLVLSAIGLAVLYIGIVASNITYEILNIYTTAIAIFGWTVLSLSCYIKYNKKAILLVTSLGIYTSVILVGLKLLQDGTSQIVPLYTMLVLLITLTPVVVGNIESVRRKIQDKWYSSITIGVAITSIVTYSMMFKDYCYNIDSNILKITGVTLIIVMAILTYIEDARSKIKAGVYMTEIQSILMVSLLLLVELFNNSIAAPIMYLIICALIASKELKGQKVYRYVALNIAFGIYGLSDMIAYDISILSYEIMIMLNILVVIAVSNIPSRDRLSNNTQTNRYISTSILLVMLFTIWGYSLSDGINTINIILDIILLIAITVVTNIVSNDCSKNEQYALKQVIKLVIDIAILNMLLYRFGFYIAIVLFTVHLLYIRKNSKRWDGKAYKLLYTFEVLATAICIFIAELIFDSAWLILSSILMILLLSTYITKEDDDLVKIKALISSLGTVIFVLMSIALTSGFGGKTFGYISIVSMILSSSIMILVGIIRTDKIMRVTATIILLISTWILVNSMSILSSTMGNVVALLVSGLIVLAVSIICSKVEKSAALKEKLKKKNTDESSEW